MLAAPTVSSMMDIAIVSYEVVEALLLEEEFRIGLTAAEILIEHSCISRVALGENLIAEAGSGCRIENITCFYKRMECIGIEYSRPRVRIVASLVARGEDMVVEGRAIASDNLRNHAHLSHRSSLESVYVNRIHRGEHMVVHIED